MAEPEIWRVEITDASKNVLATLHWRSSTEYLVYAPDGQLIGIVQQMRSTSWAAWGARVDVLISRKGFDIQGDDPILLAANLAQNYAADRQGGEES